MENFNNGIERKSLSLPAVEEKDVFRSYKWGNKNAIGTFPAWIWVPVLLDFIYYGKGTHETEAKWTAQVPTIKRPSNTDV